jgi:hypothetical protein
VQELVQEQRRERRARVHADVPPVEDATGHEALQALVEQPEPAREQQREHHADSSAGPAMGARAGVAGEQRHQPVLQEMHALFRNRQPEQEHGHHAQQRRHDHERNPIGEPAVEKHVVNDDRDRERIQARDAGAQKVRVA